MPLLHEFYTNYTNDQRILNLMMTIVKQFNCSILEQENQLFCIMKVGVPKKREAEVLYSLKEIKGVEIKAL